MLITRTHVSLLVAAIAVVCAVHWAAPAHSQPTAATPPRPVWEYKAILLTRSVGSEFAWAEDGQALEGTPNMIAKAKELGEQGWELVTVTPVSSESVEGRTGFTSS